MVFAMNFVLIISATYNYIINYKLVFQSKGSVKTTGIKYIILAIF